MLHFGSSTEQENTLSQSSFPPTNPLAIRTESQRVVVGIYLYKMGRSFKNMLYDQ